MNWTIYPNDSIHPARLARRWCNIGSSAHRTFTCLCTSAAWCPDYPRCWLGSVLDGLNPDHVRVVACGIGRIEASRPSAQWDVAPSSALLDLIFADAKTALHVLLGSLQEHLIPPEPLLDVRFLLLLLRSKLATFLKAVIFRGGTQISR